MNKQVDETFQEIKLGHKHRFVIYKLNEPMTEIMVEHIAPPSQTYADFLKFLPKDDCRYAVFDANYTEKDGGERNKLVFVVWCPDTAKIKSKMVYASSKDALRKKLVGVALEIQATDPEEIEYDTVLGKLQK